MAINLKRQTAGNEKQQMLKKQKEEEEKQKKAAKKTTAAKTVQKAAKTNNSYATSPKGLSNQNKTSSNKAGSSVVKTTTTQKRNTDNLEKSREKQRLSQARINQYNNKATAADKRVLEKSEKGWIGDVTRASIDQAVGGKMKAIGKDSNEYQKQKDVIEHNYQLNKITKAERDNALRNLDNSGLGKAFKDYEQDASHKTFQKIYDKGNELQKRGDQQIEKTTKNMSRLEKFGAGALQSGIGMAADIAVGGALGRVASLASKEASAQKFLNILSNLGAMGERSYGNALQDTDESGLTEVQNIRNAVLSGTNEGAQELLFAGIGPASKLVGGRGLINKLGSLADNAVKVANTSAMKNLVFNAVKYLGGIAEESTEELVGWAVDPIMQYVAYGRDMNDKARRDAAGTLSDETSGYMETINRVAKATGQNPQAVLNSFISSLNSKEFLDERIAEYKKSGMSDEQAKAMAAATIEYITAQMSGDAESAEKLKNAAVDVLMKDSPFNVSWSTEDLIDTIGSTVVLTGVTGIGSVAGINVGGQEIKRSLDQQGADLKAKLGFDGVGDLLKNLMASEDAKTAARAKSMMEYTSSGNELANGQIYELAQSFYEENAKKQQKINAANEVAKKAISANGDHKNIDEEVIQAINDDTVIAMDRALKKTGVELDDKTTQNVAEAVTRYQLGEITIDDLTTLSAENTDARAIFNSMAEEKGAAPLPVVTLRNGQVDVAATNEATNDFLIRGSIANAIETASAEMYNWTDKTKPIIDAKIKNSLGSNGQQAYEGLITAQDAKNPIMYQTKQSVFQAIYQAARNGVSKEELTSIDNPAWNSVPAAVKDAAYDAGIKDRALQSMSGTIIQAGEPIKRNKSKKNEAGVLLIETSPENTPRASQTSALESAANATGITIHYVDEVTVTDAEGNKQSVGNGMYDPETNEIWLSAQNNVATNIAYTFMHEYTHSLQVNAPEQYNAYREAVKKGIIEKYGDEYLTDMLDDVYARYESRGAEKSLQTNGMRDDNKVLDEVVADMSREFLNDEEFAQNVCEDNPTLGRAIIDSIKNVIRKLRSILAHTGKNIKTMMDELDNWKEIERLWMEAAHVAARNIADRNIDRFIKGERYDIEEREYHNDAQRKIINEYNNSTDQNLLDMFDDVKAGKKVKNVQIGIVDANMAEDVLKALPDDLYSDGFTPDGYKIVAGKSYYTHTENRHGLNGDQDQTMSDDNDKARIGYVINNYDTVEPGEDGKFSRENKMVDKNGKTIGSPSVIFQKKVNGTMLVVVAVPDAAAKELRVVTAYMDTKKEGIQMPDVKSPGSTSETMSDYPSSDNLSQKEDEVKYSITPEQDAAYMEAVDSGDMETAQRLVDEAAKKAGYTDIVYHGTNADFNIFQNGNGQYGEGIYVTHSKDVAEAYGDTVIKLYAKPTNIATYDDAGKVLGIEDLSNYWDEVEGSPEDDMTDLYYHPETADKLLEAGYNGFEDEGNDGFVIFPADKYDNRTLIKRADPVTYDDNGNVIPPSERFNAENPDVRYSITEDVTGRQLSPGQQEFFADVDSHLLDEEGRLKRYYHGTQRADRVGTVFRPERATSGPMSYFTDNPDIALGYSKSKNDTSLAYDEDEEYLYESQFRTKKPGTEGKGTKLTDMWYKISSEARQTLTKNAGHVTRDYDNDDGTIIYDENNTESTGGFSYHLKEYRGNVLKALNYQWLESGELFGEETKYFEVLDMLNINKYLEDAGYSPVQYLDPNKTEEKVYEVYLNVTNPVVSTDLTMEDVKALREWADTVSEREIERYQEGTDWGHKNHESPSSWIDTLEDDVKNGTTFAWVSIPDLVTDYFKGKGHDGYVDLGGKNGLDEHQVVIPFSSEQVKNVDNENPTNNPDIRYSIPADDSKGRELSEGQRQYFDNSKALSQNGGLAVVYHTTNHGGFTVFDPTFSDDYISLFFAEGFETSQSYGKHARIKFYLGELNTVEDLINYLNSLPEETRMLFTAVNVNTGEITDPFDDGNTFLNKVQSGEVDANEWEIKIPLANYTGSGADDFTTITARGIDNVLRILDERLHPDGLYQIMMPEESGGVLQSAKHGFELNDNLHITVHFREEISGQVHNVLTSNYEDFKNLYENGYPGAKSEITGYTVFSVVPGEDPIQSSNWNALGSGSTLGVAILRYNDMIFVHNMDMERGGAERHGYYECYLNIENPMIVDAEGANWNVVPYGESNVEKLYYRNVNLQKTLEYNGDSNIFSIKISGNYEFRGADENSWFYEELEDKTYTLPENVMDLFTDDEAYINAYSELEIQAMNDIKNAGLPFRIAEELFNGANEDYTGDASIENWNFDKDGNKIADVVERDFFTTRELARIALDNGNDGVIIRNVTDPGPYASYGAYEPTDLYIAFNSNQVKSVDNLNPTENPDIRYSFSGDDDFISYMAEHPEEFTDDIDNRPYQDRELEESRQRRINIKQEMREYAEQKHKETVLTHDLVLNTKTIHEDCIELVKQLMQNSEYVTASGKPGKYSSSVLKFVEDSEKKMFELVKKGDYDGVAELSWDVAAELIESIDVVNDEVFSQYKEVRDYFKTQKIYVPNNIRSDFSKGYNEFRKANFNRLNLTNNPSNPAIDNIWDDVIERFGTMFDPDAEHPVDMLQNVAEVMDGLSDYKYAYSSEEAYELIRELQGDLVDIATDGEAWHSFADKKKAQYDERTKRLKERHREAITELKRKNAKKVEAVKEHYKKKEQKKKEKKLHAEMYGDILENYDWLTTRLLKPTDDKHIPEGFKISLAGLLQQMDLQTERSKQLEEKLGKAQKTLKMDELRRKLGELAKEDDSGVFEYDGYIFQIMDALAERLDGQSIDSMDNQDLHNIDVLLSYIRKQIQNYNQALADEKGRKISDLALNFIDRANGQIEKRGKKVERSGIAGGVSWIVDESMVTPIDMFERLGGGMLDSYKALRRGFDKHERNIKYLRENVFAPILGQYDSNKKIANLRLPGSELESWRNDKNIKEFTLENGETIKMNPAQIMSLYCLAKREQAMGHIYGSGIVVTNVDSSSKIKEAIGAKKTISKTAVLVTANDVKNIVTSLNADQIKVADQMQEVLNTTLSDWGNETSMLMYGYKKFTEQNYFPIKSADNYLDSNFESREMVERIRNFGFTKGTVVNANNPIVIDDFFTVIADHMNKMSLYNAFAAPIADFQRVYNFKQRNDEGVLVGSVKSSITDAFGTSAIKYINTFMADLNGTTKVSVDGTEKVALKYLGRYKKAAVAGNIRVGLQQPTAIIRAFDVISPKHFHGGINVRANMKEMYEHCPIAEWKAWGNYQIDMGRNLEEIMMNRDWTPLDAATLEMYGVLDNVTWSVIWNAVKNEVKATHKNVEYGSEEFWNLCNERASEVFDKTQVVDSAFHRSQGMRSKSTFMRLMTSFKAEPTRTFNMVRSDLIKAREMWANGDKSGARKQMSKTLTVFVANAAVVSMAAAIADALRGKGGDDDDKLPFWEAWWNNAIENFKDNGNMLNNIYFVSDALSLKDGWGTSNMALEGFEALANAINMWEKIAKGEGKKTPADALKKTVEAIGYLTGIPTKNVMRDTKAIFDALGIVMPSFAADGTVDEQKNAKTVNLFEKLGVKDGSDLDNLLNHFGINRTEEEQKQIEFDKKLSDIESKVEGLTGYEKEDKIWELASEGYTKLVEGYDLDGIDEMRQLIIATGGDINAADEKLKPKFKTAYKKTIGESDMINEQAEMKDYMKSVLGFTDTEISDICYSSETGKKFKAACRILDHDMAVEALRALYAAGLTDEDVDKLWKNRNRGDVSRYLNVESTGQFAWPTSGQITSAYGERTAPTAGASSYHEGIDIGAASGSNVAAADGGRVVFAGYNGGYGYQIVIQHDNGMQTVYSHLSKINTNVGDTVAKSQSIGNVGSSGTSTGPHLDFRIKDANGDYVNPQRYLT